MKTINVYIAKEIIRAFVFIILTVVVIFLAIEFSEKIDNIIEARLPQDQAIAFFQYRIPFIIAQVLPIGLLMGIIIGLGLMNKHNEILALRCNGVSLSMLLKPVLAVSIIMSVGLFLLNDVLVPITVAKSNRIWSEGVDKKKAAVSRQKNIWLKGDGSISHIKFFDRANQAISGVTIYYFENGFHLGKRIDARSGRYLDGQWILHEVIVQRINADGGPAGTEFFDQLQTDLGILPQDLHKVVKKAEEMNFFELQQYIHDIESEGYDATAYKVDLQGKIAFPLVCIILGLTAAAISIRRKVKENITISVGIGVGMIFLYYIFHNFFLSLGYGDVLPHYIAPWVANFLFFCISGIALLNAD